jgi:hypothetical protein
MPGDSFLRKGDASIQIAPVKSEVVADGVFYDPSAQLDEAPLFDVDKII